MTNQSPSLFGRVLIALDGSKAASWASQVGQRLAGQLHARVLLVHVVEPLPAMTGEYVSPAYVEEERQHKADMLLAQAKAAFPIGFEPEIAKREGLPFEEVVAAAREWKADLIVVGTSGRGRLAQFVLGSTANQIIRHAPCPVISVAHELSAIPSDERGQRPSATTAAVAVACRHMPI